MVIKKYIKFHFRRHLDDNGGEIIDYIIFPYIELNFINDNLLEFENPETNNIITFSLSNVLYYELYER